MHSTASRTLEVHVQQSFSSIRKALPVRKYVDTSPRRGFSARPYCLFRKIFRPGQRGTTRFESRVQTVTVTENRIESIMVFEEEEDSSEMQMDLKLAMEIVSKELGRPQEVVARDFTILKDLLPDLTSHVATMDLKDLVRLSSDLVAIADKLLILKEALPSANISGIVAACPALLSLNREELIKNMEQVRNMLAPHDPNWQTLLEDAPSLAIASHLSSTIEEIRRTFTLVAKHKDSEAVALLAICIGMGLGSPKWPSLDASSDESDLLWL